MNVPGSPSAAHQHEGPEERLRLLMGRSLDGDSQAYRQLLGELSRYLRGYYARRIGSQEVEGLVQETLLAVHLKRDTYDRALPFTPWAYAVARYKLADRLRRDHAPHIRREEVGDLLALKITEERTMSSDLGKLLEGRPTLQGARIGDVKPKVGSVEEAARRRGVTAVSARIMLHRGLKRVIQAVGVADPPS